MNSENEMNRRKTSLALNRWDSVTLGVIIVLCLASYGGSFSAPFTRDDHDAILLNPNVHSVFPLSTSMWAPQQNPLTTRPIASLSFALNYAVGQEDPFTYHIVNFGLHVITAWIFYLIVRWTLATSNLRTPLVSESRTVAFTTAMLWALHPLHTESVIYVTQRTELLVTLFLLLTLLFAIVCWNAKRPWLWGVLSVLCCGLGMGSKEIMVSAPLIVVAYDFAFRGDDLKSKWRQRARLYAGLFATWILLAVLVATSTRAESVGYEHNITTWQYLQLECWAISQYVWLTIWPYGMSTDYGNAIDAIGQVSPISGAVLIAGLLSATVVAWFRNRPLAFLGTTFFLILAPTSSFLPIITEFAAERRMYIPLMCILAAVVCGSFVLLWRALEISRKTSMLRHWAFGGLAALSLALMAMTFERSFVYQSAESVYRDSTEKCPWNVRAFNGLAMQLANDEEVQKAIRVVEECAELNPNNPSALTNAGLFYAYLNQYDAAIEWYEKSLEVDDELEATHCNMGNALIFARRDFSGAKEHFERALELDPDHQLANYNLGNLLCKQDPETAIDHFRKAVCEHLKYNQRSRRRLAETLADAGRHGEATTELKRIIELIPEDPVPWNILGKIAMSENDYDQAESHFQTALEKSPDHSGVLLNLASLQIKTDQTEDAQSTYQRVLEIEPANPMANKAIARLLMQEEPQQALKHLETVLKANQRDFGAWYQTGLIHAKHKNYAPAKTCFQQALNLQPNFAAARAELDKIVKLSQQNGESDG